MTVRDMLMCVSVCVCVRVGGWVCVCTCAHVMCVSLHKDEYMHANIQTSIHIPARIYTDKNVL